MFVQRLTAGFLLAMPFGWAVIVDRVACIVGSAIVKDSDIEEDLRIIAFLNNGAPQFTPTARKKAASRLVDQTLIRKEIQSGEYPSASVAEARDLLADLKKRYPDEALYRKALASRGINEEDLMAHLLWQLSVLRFIDLRFRPAAAPSDEEIEKYFNDHRAQLQAANPGKPATLDALRQQIVDAVTGERVNQLLDEWLTRRHKDTKVVCVEDALK